MIITNSFSIVTPNYNMAQFLSETIKSVLVNLKPGDQYFIIDGGSADGSIDVIRAFESRLTGWISEPDRGYADALSKGFQRCTGEFLCWINSGDLLLPGALAAARKALDETGADLIFGDDVYIDEHNRVISHSSGHVRSLRNMMLYGGWTPLQDACFWRRSLYEQAGGIDPTLRFAADYDFFLRASCLGCCVYVPTTFSAFRRHGGQKSVSGASDYEVERHMVRRRVLERLGVARPSRAMAEAYYWLSVRWRHHVARRLHRSSIPRGISVFDLRVE